MKKILRIFILIFIAIIIIALIPFGDNPEIKYIERDSGEIKIEKVYGEKWLSWLYNNPIGELSTAVLVKRKFLSDWYGSRMDMPESKEKIADFIKNYNIDTSILIKHNFVSFNDFFYRKLKADARIIDSNINTLVSPADGKILAFSHIKEQDFIIKGYKFNIDEYFQNKHLANKYRNGSMMIIRLCPTDYHRYHFPVDGSIISEKLINGDYYSVSPIALKKKAEIISQNKRAYCIIRTQYFGEIIMSEVAATMVGSMVYTYNGVEVKKGQERGYFKFGGSTIVLFFEKNKILIDKDLQDNSLLGLETEVKMGERIGVFEMPYDTLDSSGSVR